MIELDVCFMKEEQIFQSTSHEGKGKVLKSTLVSQLSPSLKASGEVQSSHSTYFHQFSLFLKYSQKFSNLISVNIPPKNEEGLLFFFKNGGILCLILYCAYSIRVGQGSYPSRSQHRIPLPSPLCDNTYV